MQLLMTIPILISRDLRRTETFYHLVGFETYVMYDDYLTMHQSGVELHFQLRDASAGPRTTYCRVTGVDAWYARAAERLAPEQLLSQPTDQFYGIREFSLRDPDGNVLHLGEYLPRS